MLISSKVPCFSQEQVSCSIFNIDRKSLPFPWVNSSPGLFYGNRTLRTLAEAINLFMEARESGLKDSKSECRSIHIRTDQGRAIFCLLGVSFYEINRQWSVLSDTVCQDVFGPPFPSQWLSHCGSFSTWVCPRLTRKGNALNTTPWTKSQTNNLIPHFFSTRFDTFHNQTYSTPTMLKRKSTAGEAAVAETRPRRSLRNAQPASEPEPVAASTPTVKESKKAQTKNTPKAAVKRGGRKTPQKVEEEPVGLFFISVSGWKGLFSTNAMSLPLAISTHDLAMPSPPAPNHTTSPSLT